MKIIDLSHKFETPMPLCPGDFQPEITVSANIEIEGFNDTRLTTTMHIGTHIDAPWHMLREGKKISDFSVEKFSGAGKLIDMRGRLRIEASDFEKAELEEGDVVILRSDWSEKYRKPEYFENFPVLSVEAAEFLVEKKINMLGIDWPSPDLAPFLVHKKLLSNEILILENLNDLVVLEGQKQFEIFAFPPNIPTDGFPVRVVARI